MNYKMAAAAVGETLTVIHTLQMMHFHDTVRSKEIIKQIGTDSILALHKLQAALSDLADKNVAEGFDWDKYSDLGLVISPPDLWARTEQMKKGK
jgi:hypothetical protein